MADEVVRIPMDQIRTDGGTQVREVLNKEALEEYEELYADGSPQPPLRVVESEGEYWLYDGFHRYEVRRKGGEEFAECLVVAGDLDHARFLAAGANTRHGVKMNTADKRRAVLMALDVYPQLSAREIARHCGVSHTLVNNLKTASTSAVAREQVVAVEEPIPEPVRPVEIPRTPGQKPRDRIGKPIPVALQDSFLDTKLAEYIRILMEHRVKEKVRHEIQALAPSNPYLMLKARQIDQALAEAADLMESAYTTLSQCEPAVVCPECRGKAEGCPHCLGAGWMPRWRYEEYESTKGVDGGAEAV